MTFIRKAAVWLLALTLVGFAFPALAQKSQTKYGSVNFPALLSGSGTVTIPVTFFNSTPKPGVSTINSARVTMTNGSTLPSGLGVAGIQQLTISNGTVDTSVTAKDMSGTLCSTDNPCKDFTIADFTGIGNNLGGTFLLTLVGVPDTCINILWDAAANTGNSYPGGDPFLLTKYNMATGCDGTLACWDGNGEPPSNAIFDGSSPGATSDLDSGYFKGVRAADWKGSCQLVPFKTYNNIGGTGTLTDAFGFILGPNTAVINYSGSANNGVLLAHTITFGLESAGSDGLPDPNRKTKYCKEIVSKDCTNPQNLVAARGCLSSAIDIGSIPFVNGVQEPGCIRGASWVIVAKNSEGSADEQACAALLSESSAPACVQFAFDLLEAKDPPWAR